MAQISKTANGSWAFRASTGKDDIRHQVYKSGFKTRREATIAAAKIEEELDSGKIVSDPTFADYFDKWIEAYKIGRHSEVTDEWYTIVAGYIREYFKDTKLSVIDRTAYQAFLDWLGTNPRKRSEQPLSRSTVARVNSYVRSVLKDAIEDGLTKHDFTRRAIISGKPAKDPSAKFLSVEEFKHVIEIADRHADLSHLSNYVVLIMAYTGARFEEAIGISWDRVNFKEQTITIDRSWQYKKRKQHDNFGGLKNAQSLRTVPIPSQLVLILKRLRKEQQENALKDGYRDSDNLVCRNDRHRVVTNETVNNTVKRLCGYAKTKNVITSHGLRHSHGSMLLFAGVDIMAISRRLGHASIQITMRVYLHEVDEMKQRDDKKIIDALSSI